MAQIITDAASITARGTGSKDIPECHDLIVRLQLSGGGNGVDKYPAKSHARRVAGLLSSRVHVEKGVIVLAAASSRLWPDSDMPQPFRQDRYFYYLTGCNEPGCFVTYEFKQDVLTLWLPAINKARVVWQGRGSTTEEALQKYDIDDAQYLGSPQDAVEGETSSTLNPLEQYIRAHSSTSDYAVLTLQTHCEDQLRGTSLVGEPGYRKWVKWAIDTSRVIKDEHEIELIRKANRITADAHEAVLRNLHLFRNEAEVDGEYTRVCIANHAKEQAYSPIAGSGPNASVLHYVANNEDFGDSQMMVLDAGCEFECYASDVTRTLPLNKHNPGYWVSKEAEEVYKLVEYIQESCIAQLRPGSSFYEISTLASELTLEGLMKLGILKGDREAIRKAGTHRGFFPHGLGHHVGLEVHDVAPQPSPRHSRLDTQMPYDELVKTPSGRTRVKFSYQMHTSDMNQQHTTAYIDIDEHDLDVLTSEFSEDFRKQNAIRTPINHPINRWTWALAVNNPHLHQNRPALKVAYNCLMSVKTAGSELSQRARLLQHPPYMSSMSVPWRSMSTWTTKSETTIKPLSKDYTEMKPGMVITVEPGIYFNEYLLENFFLHDPSHEQYIDKEVLRRYMPVGGVRIEDDILITKQGRENLTVAPKGEAMLECIRKGAKAAEK